MICTYLCMLEPHARSTQRCVRCATHSNCVSPAAVMSICGHARPVHSICSAWVRLFASSLHSLPFLILLYVTFRYITFIRTFCHVIIMACLPANNIDAAYHTCTCQGWQSGSNIHAFIKHMYIRTLS